MCQKQKEYGIHFHRLYKNKPNPNLGNTPLGDPDTGTIIWLGIMPRGLIIFEERVSTICMACHLYPPITFMQIAC